MIELLLIGMLRFSADSLIVNSTERVEIGCKRISLVFRPSGYVLKSYFPKKLKEGLKEYAYIKVGDKKYVLNEKEKCVLLNWLK